MPLFLNACSSLHTLSRHLCGCLQAQQKNVFAPHYLITQTEGMNNWLKLQLAEEMGIAANCQFLTPSDLIHRVYLLLGGREETVLSLDNICWLLYKILGDKDFENRFPFVSAYYQNSGPDKDVKRLALAEKMADLFDQYQIYRPEMMRQWNQFRPAEVDQDEWQQYLWAAAREASNEGLPDKTRMADYILDALKDNNDNASRLHWLKTRMPELHLFGLSIFTEYHLHLLHELSSVLDVHFHMLNPAPGIYWFEDRNEKQLAAMRARGVKGTDEMLTGHPLLTGWGKVLQDTYRMFFRYDAFLNSYEELPEEEPSSNSLLQKIQNDIYRAAAEDRHPVTETCLADGSLTINSCHTAAREVEVLYNYLVHLVDARKATISPRDIVVMVSDINAYEPYIRAVFDNAPYPFRYNIADATFAEGDNLLEALHAVLSISEESFQAERVMQLLELSYIRRRFGIGNPTKLRYLVNAANIRFGMDGHPEDDTRFVSWRYGLKRIMFGLCMSGEEGYEDHEDYFYPLDILEGGEAQDAIKFCHFAEALMRSVERRKKPLDMQGWSAYVREVMRHLVFHPDEDADEQYHFLEKQLEACNEVFQWMDEPVGYDVFSRRFLQKLSHADKSKLYASGGITFCSLIPMRSIPFKVVAMLGLGFENFPRRDRNPSFNLMLEAPRPGDRSVKENDKHLFLETLLSARQFLYISYLGSSKKDNTDLPPSVLVDELLDYIEQGMNADEGEKMRKQFVTRHPLHGFSHRYNNGTGNLYCYRRKDSAMIDLFNGKTEDPVAEDGKKQLTLQGLIKFLQHPVAGYYNKRLGIYYNDDSEESGNLLPETELFALDHLQQWSFKNQLLHCDEAGIAALEKRSRRTGLLPLSNMATHVLKEVEELVKPVRPLYGDCVKGCLPRSVAFEIELDNGILLKGNLEAVLDRKVVEVSWSKSELKHMLGAYVRLLAGAAAGELDSVEVVSASQNTVYKSRSVSAADAISRLQNLVKIYERGCQEMLPFCVKVTDHITYNKLKVEDEEGFVKMFDGWVDHFKKPCDDPYLLNAYSQHAFHADGAFEQYKALHTEMVLPVLMTFDGFEG